MPTKVGTYPRRITVLVIEGGRTTSDAQREVLLDLRERGGGNGGRRAETKAET